MKMIPKDAFILHLPDQKKLYIYYFNLSIIKLKFKFTNITIKILDYKYR